MESCLQRPVAARHLSRLYDDTKRSTGFAKEPVRSHDDPDIKALHRKLRIQNDRLDCWGLDWSDAAHSDIDESLSRAGLSHVVASIMSTIKDIMAEAEPLWQSSRRSSRSSPDRKPPLVRWDRARFEDLVHDLTASIDTLYDLSRTRSLAAVPRRMSKTSKALDEPRPFEPTRIQTPQHVDPEALIPLRPLRTHDGRPAPRAVVFMSKTTYSDLTRGAAREPCPPLLLEHAPFDPIYASTGIMPSMARFEKLSAGLQQDAHLAPGAWTGLPRLLGYYEDMDNARLGLVYRFPPSFNLLAPDGLARDSACDLPSLNDLLSRPGPEPSLEARFRLAYNLANTVFDMHDRGVTHGNLVDSNISFCHATDAGAADGSVDVRRPLVSSFDLFPDEDDSPVDSVLSRHEPHTTPASLDKTTDERLLDLYSLGKLLLSIGLWTKLEALAPQLTPGPLAASSLSDQLAARCGSLYAKAAQACLQTVDSDTAGKLTGEALLSAVQVRVSRYLEVCCILDGVSGLDGRLGRELQKQPVESSPEFRDIKSPLSFAGDKKEPAAPETAPVKEPEKADAADGQAQDASGKATKSDAKMRLYTHVPLPPDVVDKWNTVLMPQINNALRHFYRKHPESVEISLESVGSSPKETQPTVLVVCTSVGKVRAILKKRLGDLFDGTTGVGLKVCRGQVLRSRRQARPLARSMAGASHSASGPARPDDHGEAMNPEYQKQPGNGASIGAWIGDRHLPPVSFGGLVLVDNKPYGMTVHHMLDDPDCDAGREETLRSGLIPGRSWYYGLVKGAIGGGDDEDEGTRDDGDEKDCGTDDRENEQDKKDQEETGDREDKEEEEEGSAYQLSDSESEPYSDSDLTSDYGEEDEDADAEEAGDVPGIESGAGEGYIVTQPAFDDVQEGFYPCPETEDEDHLDSFSLGEVFASSGIRRKQANGLVHEVDWALFEFASGRLPDDNSMPRASNGASPRRRPSKSNEAALLRPTAVAPSSSLPGMEVQCMARTSGLRTGHILPALTSVKIYGRTSPSHTYQVTSTADEGSGRRDMPMGIPGDSGAWVVGRHHGQLCGHVLAWSDRKRVAYICPMDVLLLDVAQTLQATEIRLPGGEPIVTLADSDAASCQISESDECEAEHGSDDAAEDVQEGDGAVESALTTSCLAGHRTPGFHGLGVGSRGSSSPLRMERSSELRELAGRLEELQLGRSRRIGIT